MHELLTQVNWGDMASMAMRLAAVLLCIMVHEVCHGLAAFALGDPTAKAMHRLSFNPIRHIDPFGALMMLLVGFGWAKPVPVDPRYFKNPRTGMALTALAGPLSNFILAFVSAMCYQGVYAYVLLRGASSGMELLLEFLAMMITLNIGLGVFNLIPFPPLDGSKILGIVLSEKMYFSLMRFERYGMLLLMVVLWLGFLDTPLFAVRKFVTEGMLNGTGFVFNAVAAMLG